MGVLLIGGHGAYNMGAKEWMRAVKKLVMAMLREGLQRAIGDAGAGGKS